MRKKHFKTKHTDNGGGGRREGERKGEKRKGEGRTKGKPEGVGRHLTLEVLKIGEQTQQVVFVCDLANLGEEREGEGEEKKRNREKESDKKRNK